MDEILKKDIGKLKFLSETEIDYLKCKKPNKSKYFIVSFQEALRNCLLEYLNTPFLLSNKKSKPVGILKEQYLQMGIETQSLNFNLKIKNLFSIISHGYTKLQVVLEKFKLLGFEHEKKLNLVTIKKNYYSEFSVIEEYIAFTKTSLTSYLKSSIIHGSCADLELTSFSDLDTFLVISKETIFSENQLEKFKKKWLESLKYLYKFDCLQHHNHMVTTEVDLSFFPYHWLPPQILKESKLVCGSSALIFNINKSSFLNAKVFYTLAQRFRDPYIKNKKYTEYSLKNDISILSLLPVLYLQSIGIDATKKESFYHHKILSIDDDAFFKKISILRKEWKVTKKSKFIISRMYNFYTRKVYLKYMIGFIGSSEVTNNSVLKKEFLENLNRLIDKMSAGIIKESQ